jgi:hypothetical protein
VLAFADRIKAAAVQNHGLIWMWQLAVQLGAELRGIIDGVPVGSRPALDEREPESTR